MVLISNPRYVRGLILLKAPGLVNKMQALPGLVLFCEISYS